MYKSIKSSSSWSNKSSSNSNSRRYSQPVAPHPSSMASGRRGSELAAAGRAVEVAPPPGPQYDDKLSVMEATKGGRKGRSKDNSDLASFDRDKFNPDGSLRTVHRVPEFCDLYNRVRGTRYLRHPELQPYEIELTTQQIFSDESS